MLGTMKEALVIDDIAVMRRFVASHLKKLGFELVREAADAKCALDDLHARPADLVITDLNMEGMTGSDLVRAMRADAALKEVPVIVMTTPDAESKLSDILGSGPTAVVYKPFDGGKLRSGIEALAASAARRT